MHEKTSIAALSIRELMPAGFLRILLKHTSCKQRSTISDVVLLEQTTSKYWPAVLALAQETNPAGFATWAAANPDKVPAVAQAA